MIKGLTYFPEWITERHAETLVALIEESQWDKNNQQVYEEGNLPRWADTLAMMLSQDSIMRPEPDQFVVSKYIRQTVKDHYDNRAKYGNTIATLSLLEPIDIIFTNRSDSSREIGEEEQFVLGRRSLLVMSGPARFFWSHRCWPTSDVHISIVMRETLDEFMRIDDDLAFEARALGGIASYER